MKIIFVFWYMSSSKIPKNNKNASPNNNASFRELNLKKVNAINTAYQNYDSNGKLQGWRRITHNVYEISDGNSKIHVIGNLDDIANSLRTRIVFKVPKNKTLGDIRKDLRPRFIIDDLDQRKKAGKALINQLHSLKLLAP